MPAGSPLACTCGLCADPFYGQYRHLAEPPFPPPADQVWKLRWMVEWRPPGWRKRRHVDVIEQRLRPCELLWLVRMVHQAGGVAPRLYRLATLIWANGSTNEPLYRAPEADVIARAPEIPPLDLRPPSGWIDPDTGEVYP